MSVFIVSERHIDYMLSAARDFFHEGEFDYLGVPAMAAKLERANVESFAHRYPRDAGTVTLPDPSAPTREPRLLRRGKVTIVQTIKAVQCYEYQACEWPAWEGSDAQRFCVRLMGAAIMNLVGYDGAAWGIE